MLGLPQTLTESVRTAERPMSGNVGKAEGAGIVQPGEEKAQG